MTPEVQRYLIDYLTFIRYARRRGDDQQTSSLLANITGALQALKVSRAVGSVEYDEWLERAGDAAGLFGKPTTPPSGSGGMHAGPQAARGATATAVSTATPHAPRLPPRFLRLIPGPDEQEFHGGRLRMLALELYDSQMVVQWRAAPLPDPPAIAQRELSLLDGATEGLPAPERERLHTAQALESISYLWQSFVVSDDLGTAYRLVGSSGDAGPSGNEMSGRLVVEPTAPVPASIIDVGVLDVHFRFDLTIA